MYLKAFSVYDWWARLVVFSLCDPHGLKCWQRSQNGATDPDRVFTFWWSNDLDLHGAWRQLGYLLLKSIGNTWKHCGATRQHIVGIQVLSDINVASHDRRVSGLMEAGNFHAQKWGLKQRLGSSESLITNGDHLTIRQLITFLQCWRGGSCGHFRLKIQGNITQFFLFK